MNYTKTAIITGGTSGIGQATVTGLLEKGYKVIVPARDIEKGEICAEEWKNKTGNKNIFIMKCDLASFDSIRNFADEYGRVHRQTDVLINNAGLWNKSRKVSSDNIELMFAVNHLAVFLLTGLLLNTIPEGGRIINVSSEAHRNATLNFDDIENEKSFNGYRVYAQTKLCNILFTNYLSEKLVNRKISVNSLDPGFVSTNIFHEYNVILRKLAKIFMINSKKGAETNIMLATRTNGTDLTGKYYLNKTLKNPSKVALDKDIAIKLWNISQEYTRIIY